MEITIQGINGKQRKVSSDSWSRWPIAKDALGRVIPGHRMWGQVPAFNVADDLAPKPLQKPIVPEEVRKPVVPEEVMAVDPNHIPEVVEPKKKMGRPKKSK